VPSRPPGLPAVVAVGLLAVAGCSGGAPSTTGTGASSTAPATSAAPSATPSVTVSVTSSPSRTAASASPRTEAGLTSALLELKDLPAGFQEEDADDDGPAPRATSPQARCRPLVRLTNLKTPPGTKASVAAAFSGGQAGPVIGEQLDALGSAGTATSQVRSFAAAVKACRSLRLTVPGTGTSTVTVRAVRAPDAPGATAVRFAANDGPLEGLEITQVIVPVTDVVLTMTFIGATPEDVEGASRLAVEKAVDVLGGGGAA